MEGMRGRCARRKYFTSVCMMSFQWIYSRVHRMYDHWECWYFYLFTMKKGCATKVWILLKSSNHRKNNPPLLSSQQTSPISLHCFIYLRRCTEGLSENFSSADYRFLMFSECLSWEIPTHIYISIYATQPMNEHHSFQPPDLENVISRQYPQMSSSIYTHSHAWNDTREMMAKQPEKQPPH